MAENFSPLEEDVFTTTHSFVLDYMALQDDVDETEEGLAAEMLQYGMNPETLISYLFDRMTLERGGKPQDRGIMFKKEARGMRRDLEKNKEETRARLAKEEEYKELDKLTLDLAVNTALMMSIYLPLLAEVEKDSPLSV